MSDEAEPVFTLTLAVRRDVFKYALAALGITVPAFLLLSWFWLELKKVEAKTTTFVQAGELEDARLIIRADSASQAYRLQRARERMKKKGKRENPIP